MDFSKEYIAQIIKTARKAQSLKQSELAEKVGITEKHLSKIETGRNYPALDNFLKIVEVLNLSLKDFGLNNEDFASEKKIYLQKIINTSSEKQLNIYIDVLNSLKKHL